MVEPMSRGRPPELFPTDGPLAPGELIGRGDDIAHIEQQLRAGINVVLASPRRTGKTTVCDSVTAGLAADDGSFYVARLDLFEVDGIGQMADELIAATVSNRPALRKALHAARRSGRTLYESVGVTLTPKLLGAGEIDGIDIGVLSRLPDDPVAHLDYALALPQRVAAADNKRLVLYIDEFQDVERIGDSFKRDWAVVLKRKMRAAFQRSPDVSFLFAGSLEHMMRDIFGSSNEPFFHFGGFHRLAPITVEEWHDGLTERFARDRTRIDPAALKFVIDCGEGHPRATMLLAQRAHLDSILAGTRTIDAGMTALAYEECLRAEQPKHEAFVDRIRHLGRRALNQVALPIVAVVAAGGKPYAGVKNPTDRSRALDALRDAGFIEHVSPQGWRVVDPLFAEYLRRKHARR